MIEEDFLPQKQPARAKSLVNMSIIELEQYIEDLKAEIRRAEGDIARKKAPAMRRRAFSSRRDKTANTHELKKKIF